MVGWKIWEDGRFGQTITLQSKWICKSQSKRIRRDTFGDRDNSKQPPTDLLGRWYCFSSTHTKQFDSWTTNDLTWRRLYTEDEEKPNMKRWRRNIKKCKVSIWNRWNAVYLRTLSKWHIMRREINKMMIVIGEVALIRNEGCNRWKWRNGVID